MCVFLPVCVKPYEHILLPGRSTRVAAISLFDRKSVFFVIRTLSPLFYSVSYCRHVCVCLYVCVVSWSHRGREGIFSGLFCAFEEDILGGLDTW